MITSWGCSDISIWYRRSIYIRLVSGLIDTHLQRDVTGWCTSRRPPKGPPKGPKPQAPYGGKTASPKKEGEIQFCVVLRIACKFAALTDRVVWTFSRGFEVDWVRVRFFCPRGFSTDQKHRLFAQLKRLQRSPEVEAEDTDRADSSMVAWNITLFAT